MDVLRWRKPLAGLGLAFSMTSLAWAAPPEALVQNQGALLGSFVLLSVALGGLGLAEMKANKGRSFDLEIDRLAAAAAQRQAKKSGDVSGLLDDDSIAPAAMSARVPEKAPPPPPTAGMPPPPPPPTRAAAPPPPPPPPPPFSEAGDSFGARLAAADDLARPASKTAPISFGGAPAPPPPAETGSPSGGGGGWADLLQRVRSNENDQPNPFKGGGPSAIPSTEEDTAPSKPTPSGGGDAWEALLRKTAGAASGEVPPAAIPRPGVGLPSSSPFASGNTGGSGSDPEPGRAPSGESDESLPDFIKKSGRTISLDLNKGGAASNPFQKPPQ